MDSNLKSALQELDSLDYKLNVELNDTVMPFTKQWQEKTGLEVQKPFPKNFTEKLKSMASIVPPNGESATQQFFRLKWEITTLLRISRAIGQNNPPCVNFDDIESLEMRFLKCRARIILAYEECNTHSIAMNKLVYLQALANRNGIQR